MIGLAAALAAAALGGGQQPARPPAVGIGLLEWEVDVYRPAVPAGKLRLNITNLGEDTHDLVVRRPGGSTVERVPEMRPGARRTARVALKPGRYELYCSIADHEELGMLGRLKVTKRG